MRTENKKRRITIPPAREPTGGANEDVSWLRATQLAFPGYPSGFEPITACPLQWRGRARGSPAFASPFSKKNLAQSMWRRGSARCPDERHHHTARAHPPDVPRQKLRSKYF